MFKNRLIVDISLLMSPERLFPSTELTILRLEGKPDQLTLSNQEPLMMESGKEDSGTEEEFRNGLMVPYTKVNGRIIEHMDKVNSPILMEIYTRANGSTTKPMDMVSIIT